MGGRLSPQRLDARALHQRRPGRTRLGARRGTDRGPLCGRSDPPALAHATIRKSAAVAAAPGGPAWARVVRDLGVDIFPIAPADDWVRVAAIPGLVGPPCAELDKPGSTYGILSPNVAERAGDDLEIPEPVTGDPVTGYCMRTHCGRLIAYALVGATSFGCGGSHAMPDGSDRAGADGTQTGAGGSTTDGDTSADDAGTSTGGQSGTGGSGAGGARDAGTSTGGQPGTGGSGAGGGAVIARPWDWAGVVGTGQSLAVGAQGMPIATTTQPYHNLKLSTGTLPWPIDPSNTSLTMTALIEPVGRLAPTFPSSWPTNIDGETAHASMANEITALVRAADGGDYVGVHGEVGEDGQGIMFLRKNATQVGVNGHAYQATLIETQAITRLARAMGKTYGVGAIIVTHGEADSGSPTYENDLFQLWSDYQTDLPAITGQTQKIQMIVSQQNSINDRSPSTLAQWKIGVDHPGDVVCSGPKYQYPYTGDHIHLVTDGYRQLGEKYGQVYFERVVLGRDWRPLAPTTVERSGARIVTVHFHIPVPPLVWDTTFPAPHQAIPEWQAGKGFELRSAAGRIAIASVAISGDAVQITTAADLPATGVFVGYALTGDATARTTPFVGTFRWGQLRDSDPFVGGATQTRQPNYAVAFELPVP